MPQFAVLNQSDIVVGVIEADQAFIDSGAAGDPALCVLTDAGTRGGASAGFTFDRAKNVFYPPSPYASWSRTEDGCEWAPPTPHPQDGRPYAWDEAAKQWALSPRSVE